MDVRTAGGTGVGVGAGTVVAVGGIVDVALGIAVGKAGISVGVVNGGVVGEEAAMTGSTDATRPFGARVAIGGIKCPGIGVPGEAASVTAPRGAQALR